MRRIRAARFRFFLSLSLSFSLFPCTLQVHVYALSYIRKQRNNTRAQNYARHTRDSFKTSILPFYILLTHSISPFTLTLIRFPSPSPFNPCFSFIHLLRFSFIPFTLSFNRPPSDFYSIPQWPTTSIYFRKNSPHLRAVWKYFRRKLRVSFLRTIFK